MNTEHDSGTRRRGLRGDGGGDRHGTGSGLRGHRGGAGRARTGRAWRTVLALGGVVTLGACSATGGAPRSTPGGEGGGTVDTPRMTVAMVSHGAPGDTFWDLVRKGAEDAARKDNVELRYSSDPQAPNQANLVQNAVDSRVDGIAVTMPTPDAIGPAVQRAVDAGVTVVGLNAGMDQYRRYGMSGFFGQEEGVAGEQAGRRLAADGATKALCVIHEQGNSSQEARCAGLRTGLAAGAGERATGGNGGGGGASGGTRAGGTVETLYVNGQDLTAVQSTVQAKLAQDRGIDWVVGLVAPVALTAVSAARDAGSTAKIATFDTNAELVAAIRKGDVQWAVDQQPYLQGYLAVDALWLARRNGSTVGGGRPVYTGPSFVDADTVDTIADAAKEGLR